MAVRFYVDADCLGLARILAGLRDDVTYPGDPGGMIRKRSRPPCVITTPDTADSVWIPQVAALGWGIITRDRAIQRKPAELAAVNAHGAKMFAITTTEKLSTWHLLEIVTINWRRMESLLGDPGPFIYAITRTGARKVL